MELIFSKFKLYLTSSLKSEEESELTQSKKIFPHTFMTNLVVAFSCVKHTCNNPTIDGEKAFDI